MQGKRKLFLPLAFALALGDGAAREYRERPRDWRRRDCARVGPVWVCTR